MPKSKRPSVLNVSGRKIRVIYRIPDDYDAGLIMGLHFALENEIRINPDMALDQQKTTMIHELCHDLELITGITVSEQDIASFSSALFHALRGNPRLVSWLMEK